ncbi:GNL3L/Grn1 putative GTPase-domain-containing protein [Pilobolus umbonatus]|nr:GNL3L/Grn1 putative GTPase-domain-containing protein [Pilobolus umbonatus]
MVPKKPKSKRLRLAHKNRISKRIKDSQRKSRREAKKNPSKHNKTKKDPGIPNNWPFKEEMLNQIEQEKMEVRN